MAEIEKKPVKVVETILRDAHQSLIATRMSTEQMLPIIEKLDKVGYYAVECWGGATFDASLRFLKEDPWERLRKLRDGFKNTKLQMLFRGQNILGYRPYADDVVEYFVQKSAANGIDIIRIFDCMNDLRNLQTAVKAANKEKAHAQVAMAYTLGDAYTLDYWTDLAKRIEDMGADSICIKDMAGLLVPYKATELVQALKETVKIPIDLHSHYTSGVASMTYMKASLSLKNPTRRSAQPNRMMPIKHPACVRISTTVSPSLSLKLHDILLFVYIILCTCRQVILRPNRIIFLRQPSCIYGSKRLFYKYHKPYHFLRAGFSGTQHTERTCILIWLVQQFWLAEKLLMMALP